MIEHFWNEMDDRILGCLRDAGAMSPVELGQRVGLSEGEAIAFLATLVREGRVRMRLVEEMTTPRSRITPGGEPASPPGP